MSSVSVTANSAAPVRRLLQLNIAVLLSLSGTIFACAEGAPLAAATVPIAVIGLLLVDYNPVIRLNSWGANGLGLLVLLAVGKEFLGDTLESRLLAFGHFLCYLSWILLIQEKQTRQYWWLCALSVLQVATSAVLTNSPWLGLALLLYMTYALFTLTVFSLYRAVSRSAGGELRAPSVPGLPPASISRNAVRLESSARWVTPRFMAGAAVNGLLSIVLGLLIFVFTPRVWIGQIESIAGQPLPAARLVSGASQEVQLGDLGQIMENRDLVMEVRFTDVRTDRPTTMEEFLKAVGSEAPLYRGVVLDEYQNGRWTSIDVRDSGTPNWSFSNAANRMFRNASSRYFRQDIRLRPIGSSTLYVGQRTVTCIPERGREPITHESLRNTFHREGSGEALQGEAFEYHAYSLEAGEKLPWRTNYLRQNRYLRAMEAFPPGLERVRALAHKVVRGSDESQPPPAESARRLLSWLRDSGEYGYTLSAAVTDPQVDPIVDFLVNRKQGHCEYFASSLALMLRAVGIPSRLVSGFKGGALNESSGLYEVRQLHAHAWVEAYVDEEWIVLDPTPAIRDETVAATAAASHFWTDLMTGVRDLWAMGMMLTGTQQQRILFNPLQRSAGGLLRSFTEIGSELGSGFLSGEDSAGEEGALYWITLAAVAVVALMIGLMVAALRLFGRRSGRARRRGSSGGRLLGPPVPFYERFCSILARRGFARQAAQTQREFAGALRQRWTSNGAAASIGDLSDAVTTAFYRVRFGNHSLPADELRTLDSLLDRFEESLKSSAAGNGAAH